MSTQGRLSALVAVAALAAGCTAQSDVQAAPTGSAGHLTERQMVPRRLGTTFLEANLCGLASPALLTSSHIPIGHPVSTAKVNSGTSSCRWLTPDTGLPRLSITYTYRYPDTVAELYRTSNDRDANGDLLFGVFEPVDLEVWPGLKLAKKPDGSSSCSVLIDFGELDHAEVQTNAVDPADNSDQCPTSVAVAKEFIGHVLDAQDYKPERG